MSSNSAIYQFRHRDGTSQTQRQLTALNPDYIQIEERSIADLLDFGQQYAELLYYYSKSNSKTGNWSAFLQGDPQEMAAFLENPSSLDAFPQKQAQYSRPHLVLFLIFLKLLHESHQEMNQLTQRQLDFYFKEALCFETKPAIPDQVHLVAQVSREVEQVLIPAGTLFLAGEDGEGNPMQYKTEQDLIANHGQVEKLMSVFVEKDVTTLPVLRFQSQAEPEHGFLPILSLAYRKEGSIQSPRDYPRNEEGDRAFGQPIIDELDVLNQTITENFHLRIAVFQRIMQEYHPWLAAPRWDEINEILSNCYNNRTNSQAGSSQFADIRNFDTNFTQALGFQVTGLKPDGSSVFDGVSEVNDLYELYARYQRFPDDPKLTEFIAEQFFFLPVLSVTEQADATQVATRNRQSIQIFSQFMKKRMDGLSLIQSIHQMMREAVAKHGLPPSSWNARQYEENKTLSNSFEQILGATGLSQDADLLSLETQLNGLQTYFRMKAEDYFFIRQLYLEADPTSIPTWKWTRADQLLTQAFQQLLPDAQQQLHPLPQPEIIRWKNLYQAPDTTQLVVSTSEDESYPRWKPFGTIPSKDTDPKLLYASKIGWAILSPALALTEGRRMLTLSFTFEKERFEAQRPTLENYLNNWTASTLKKGPYPFLIDISTEKAWISLSDWPLFELDATEPVMRIQVNAATDVDPFAPLKDSPNPWPSLRLILPDQPLLYTDGAGNEQQSLVYELFRDQILESLLVDIQVAGIKALTVETKEGIQNAEKPLDPFGSVPQTGDRLFITHPDLALHKLDAVSLQLEWKNLPSEGLAAYYAPYGYLGSDLGIDQLSASSFTVGMRLVETFRRMNLLPDAHSLFSETSADHEIQSVNIPNTFPADGAAYSRKIDLILEAEASQSSRYIELELQNQDFLHSRYSTLLQRQILTGNNSYTYTETVDLSALTGTTVKAVLKGIPLADENDNYSFSVSPANVSAGTYDPQTRELTLSLPAANSPEMVQVSYSQLLVLPEPYQPTLKSIEASFQSSFQVNWKSGESLPEDVVVHIEPFGQQLIQPQKETQQATSFLPTFNQEGNLYIGLKNIQPPSDISFLFQLAEGSAKPDLLPSRINWSFLAGNQWISFTDEQLLQDSTHGLLSSGLIQFFLPETATDKHWRMPEGLYWIRGQVERSTDSLSDCIEIRTQALRAEWVDPGLPSAHLKNPLQAEKITDPLEPIEGLESVLQPYSSFWGKAAEADAQLYRRSSARIRHKQRAVSMWDYEQLVLEHFPDIFKAKAICADLWGGGYDAGSVKVVVIPDIRLRKPFDPFEPKVPVVRLQEIQAFLQKHAPSFAKVQVLNPRFWHLSVRLSVRFYDMRNFGFYSEQLHREIQEYLAPWAFDHSAEIVFGGKIYLSVLVDFIENRPYVDYIDQPQMVLMKRDVDGVIRVMPNPPTDENGLFTIDAPDVIVASAYKHYIDYLALPQESSQQIRKGIGFAQIEFDFRIP
ncbi:MAG: baseplate J/gp47 family protein [Bacteroidota bacterium]